MNNFLALLFAILICTIPPHSLCGCTGIKLKAKDESIIHGRTLEFGIKVDTSIAVIPRGYQFIGTTTQGPGLRYLSKYGAVGAMTFNQLSLMDGMNEEGLSVGTFYFPGFAEYATITSENRAKALSPTEFSNWILTQFKTVDEVKEALLNVLIAPVVDKHWGGDASLPLHCL